MKLLLDEQISGKVAERLREKGHDVAATAAQAALRGLSDFDLFEVAQTQERAVATYNRPDFEALARDYAEAGREHHGLLLIHPHRFPSNELTRLVEALVGFIENPTPGKSFVVWLQPPSDRGNGGASGPAYFARLTAAQ